MKTKFKRKDLFSRRWLAINKNKAEKFARGQRRKGFKADVVSVAGTKPMVEVQIYEEVKE